MATAKQFTVFIPNEVGGLSKICSTLAEAKLNIKAISALDLFDWGLVRLLVDNESSAREVFRTKGVVFGENEVLTLDLDNKPGALAEIARKLSNEKINITYAYAGGSGDRALVVLSTTNNDAAKRIIGR